MVNSKVIIIGATSAIAEQCARIWVQQRAVELHLVGRDLEHLGQIAKDLQIRNPQSVLAIHRIDFLDPEKIQASIDNLMAKRVADIVLIAHGYLPDQTQCENNLKDCQQALNLNAISPALFAEAVVQHFTKAGQGRLAIIGSVAGDRGRKSNYVYGAAKGLLTRYVQGLQHRLAKTDIKVVLIKPGPTDTPMTAQFKQAGIKLAPVEQVAAQIVAGIQQGKSTIYTPHKWRFIMGIIQHLPTMVFNRLNI